MSLAKEKVSTVGIRNQVTLPKIIREKMRITQKTTAYIRSTEKGNFLLITLEPPTGTTFNKIKISEKGQLVIPKNLRESKKITEGTNLIFSMSGTSEIKIQKLLKKRKEQEKNWRWNFLVEIIGAMENISGLKDIEIKDMSIILDSKKGSKALDKSILETLKKIENLLGTRIMVEKIKEGKIKLTPLQ
ncbi:MAG: hypothetical protein ACTSP4_10460 [Candidatus Hodarchaeales archaeon]